MAVSILIVDDDKFTRQILGKILIRDKVTANLGPVILPASTGEEGLALFEKHRPTIAIVDLFMPKMDGFEVCRRLRAMAGPDELTIAVTSGVYKDATIAQELEGKYKASFFAKPYQVKNLAAFVANAVGETEAAPDDRNAVPAQGGELSEKGATQVLLDLMEREASGRVILRRGQAVRQVELFIGHPIKVNTNVREETLGHFLVSKKLIDTVTHRKALTRSAKEQKRLGETFIEMGVLSPQQLIQELTAQTRMKIVRGLRWSEGSWSFRPGRPRRSRVDAIDLADVVVTGLIATAAVDPPDTTIASLASKAMSLTPRGRRLLPIVSRTLSFLFLDNFRPGTTVEDLRRVGIPEVQVWAALDALWHCGAFTAEALASGRGRRASSQPQASQFSESNLFASLFDDVGQTRAGASPLASLDEVELPTAEDSKELLDLAPRLDAATASADDEGHDKDAVEEETGVSVRFSSINDDEASVKARRELLEEFLRIHDHTYYQILKVEHDASDDHIDAAYQALMQRFTKDDYQSLDLGRDFQKLDVLHGTYALARATLLDPEQRQSYDESLQIGSSGEMLAPSIDADIAFQEAEGRLEEGNFDAAVSKLKEALAIAPNEVAYQATYGWALFLQEGGSAAGADKAARELYEALQKTPDNPLVHSYLGRVLATVESKVNESLEHLSRSLDIAPQHQATLAAAQTLCHEQNRPADLDKILKRVLFRLGDSTPSRSARLWKQLGELQRDKLGQKNAALASFRRALHIVPSDQDLRQALNKLESGDRGDLFAHVRRCQDRWRETPGDVSPLREMHKVAVSGTHVDCAFLSASALVACSQAEPEEEAHYLRYRPRFVLRAQRGIDSTLWDHLLVPEDFPLVGALYSLLGRVIAEVAPNGAVEHELASARQISDSDLSEPFVAIRRYLSHLLGVPEPTIYARTELGNQLLVLSSEAPTLLAGYELLACADKLELAFRMARAMSFLRPGRAIAAGTPPRVLKTAMLACYTLRAPEARLPDPDGMLQRFQDVLQELEPHSLAQLKELVAHISKEHPTLNLSKWSKALVRTADRIGLLVCADIPLALRCLDGSQGHSELLDFALSTNHLLLRSHLGLSIDV